MRTICRRVMIMKRDLRMRKPLTRNRQNRSKRAVSQNARAVIKDDAYAAYAKLEKNSNGAIAVSFCLAHLRRYFYLAWLIIVSAAGKKAETPEGQKELSETWEWKILYEISVAEREDTGLKKVSREERLDGRISRVKPHLDKAYQYVCEYESQYQESLKASNTGTSKRIPMSATMRKAMTYFENAAKDHHIDSFLYDPDIPADNSFAERLIRSIGVQRHNSLFSYSDEGATCRMIANSIAKTAQLNKADPWYYFLYLLREIPKYQERKVDPEEYMPKMMPWSDEYRSFETREKKTMLSEDTLGIRRRKSRSLAGTANGSVLTKPQIRNRRPDPEQVNILQYPIRIEGRASDVGSTKNPAHAVLIEDPLRRIFALC